MAYEARWYFTKLGESIDPFSPQPLHPDFKVFGATTTWKMDSAWALARIVTESAEHARIETSSNGFRLPLAGVGSDLGVANLTFLNTYAPTLIHGPSTMTDIIDALGRKADPGFQRNEVVILPLAASVEVLVMER